MINRKVTILLPTFIRESDELKHLFFVLTEPCIDYETNQEQMLLLVNCSSVEGARRIDHTVILEAGAHPFIKHQSYINYSEARIENLEYLENGIKQGRFIKKEIADDGLYFRILKGLMQTKRIERRYIRFIKSAIAQNACLDVTK